MRVKDLGERGVISRIRRQWAGGGRGVVLGIGDDAALVRGPQNLLVTTDLLVEDVDFRAALHPPRLLGRKAINVNLSDIAAMGGRPLYAVLGLAMPRTTEVAWLEAFLGGFREAARRARVTLAGGDISASRQVMISVTVMGEAAAVVPRSGARPGDILFVSGTLGDAAAGRTLVEAGRWPGGRGGAGRLLRAFLDPSPRLDLGAVLAGKKIASAMIDLSDGLSVDLAHVCEESGVGAEVELGRVPMSPALRRFSDDPLNAALNGGEDFELLFAVRPRNLRRALALGPRFGITRIGRITRGRKIVAVGPDGKKRPLKIKGYEHFR
jgi:thiamine-monophosphate kinase